VINPKRREMFKDLYRLAEYYEAPQFAPGDIDGNADWFAIAQEAVLMPFLNKWADDDLAGALAFDVVEATSKLAAEANRKAPVT